MAPSSSPFGGVGKVWVPGYTKRDGTQVAGYWRDNNPAAPHLFKRARTFKMSRTFNTRAMFTRK